MRGEENTLEYLVQSGCRRLPGLRFQVFSVAKPSILRNAAIQYGNLAVVAPWLDLTMELRVPECFGLIEARGRLGVYTRSSSHSELQFRGVDSDREYGRRELIQ